VPNSKLYMRKEIMKTLARPIAHRGLHNINNGIIENSSSAFDLAIQNNYAIECDLQLSKDNVPMVFHDETLDRVTEQTGRIREIDAREIEKIALTNSSTNDRIQSFAQMLRQVDGRVPLAIELKPQKNKHENELLAKSAVQALKTYTGSIAFISFAPELLVFVKKHGFDGATGIVLDHFTSEIAKKRITPLKRFLLRHMLHYPFTKFDFVDVNHKAFDLLSYKIFKKLGFPTAAWTVKSQEQADEALKYCDQIAFEDFIPK